VIAVGMPDVRHGECIILLHSNQITSEKIQHQLLQSTMPPLMQPSKYLSIRNMPKLANSKKDYIAARKTAQNMLAKKR